MINGTGTFAGVFNYFSIAALMTELSKIDRYVIAKVREKREFLKISQIELSQKLEMTDSFVGHVETPKRRAKYNLQHINLLAKIFKCSPKDFLPEKSL